MLEKFGANVFKYSYSANRKEMYRNNNKLNFHIFSSEI